MSLLTLVNGNLSASIGPDGQLVSIKKDGLEFMHGAGKPEELKDERDRQGWNKSELVMFPIIGKAKDGVVVMRGTEYPMDQHGISRAIPFHIDEVIENLGLATMHQTHYGGRALNPKYVSGSESPTHLEWPAYSIRKTILVGSNSIGIEFLVTNMNDRAMDYRFGWHPAFRLQGTPENGELRLREDGREKALITYGEVIESSSRGALMIPRPSEIEYLDKKTKRGVMVRSTGFDYSQIWTRDAKSGMFCIEPISHLPDKAKLTNKTPHHTLVPSEGKKYNVEIMPI